jgi:hypothetical protein
LADSRSVRGPGTISMDIGQRPDLTTLAGAGLIFLAGQLHLVLTAEHLEATPYLGALFIANFIGAMVAAISIYLGKRWGWALGIMVAGGAYVTYFVAGTVGLPGVPSAHSTELLEPIGLVTKAVEALFLVTATFWVARSFAGFRRRLILIGIIEAILVVPLLAVTFGLLVPGQAQAGPGLPVKWKATSPTTNLGDKYSLLVTNTGDRPQQVNINAFVMDHSAKVNTPLVKDQLKLAPGEERELTAVNDYGTATHIMTRLASKTQDLDLSVKLADSSGKETAQYDQGAFWVDGPV